MAVATVPVHVDSPADQVRPVPAPLPASPPAFPGLLRGRLPAFSRTFVLIVACELWSEVARVEGMWPGARLAVAVLFTACAAAIWTRWKPRAAAGMAAALLAIRLACFFPLSANHYYLEVLHAFFLTLPGEDAREEDLLLRAVRMTVVVGLIASGVQKVLHGYYFGGEFLCFMLAHDPRFEVLKHLVPASEHLRLQAIETAVGAGPYRVDSWPLLAASNLTYILEIVLPIGLLLQRTRAAALCASIAFIFAIEVAARELFFGALMISSLLLFARSDLHRRLMPFFAALCLYLLATSLGLLPAWRFT